MRRAVYAGSFDPVTLGHFDIIRRSALMFDELVIGVLINNSKSPMFSIEERVEMLKEVTREIPNVKVMSFSGLLVDFAKSLDTNIIVRGLRAVTDFEHELQMAQSNRQVTKEVDTIFLTTSIEYAYLSSSVVKEYAFYDTDISMFVPKEIVPKIEQRMKEYKRQ